MQLLRSVQSDVPTEQLPKEFWVSLGMVYQAYQQEMEKLNDNLDKPPSPPPGAVMFGNDNATPEPQPTTQPSTFNQQNLG